MVTVVVDTNVLIAALVGHGKRRRLLTKIVEEHTLITSREMLAELLDVLARSTFADIKNRQVRRFLSIIATKAEIVKPTQYPNVIADDPGDNMVLATAYEGRAKYVVSGDRHILDLKEFRGIRLISVREMLEVLETDA